ncbi:efflux transporter outer membrane subunit [Steroidobacter cummioxidans]|uniref:efflux transporter outer membrane subunit n=1 Tax=Steroidobacter cummioxidans TaxID=1803913 RepID=UPI000E3175FD|nr:TolC family protein [Steroidobacter cummioxidans]
MRRTAIAIAVAALLSACAQMPERNVPTDVEGMLPDRFTDVVAIPDTGVPPTWWQAFDDPKLVSLVESGLQYNSDLIVAAERLREAHATMRSVRSAQLPEVSASVAGTRQRTWVAGLPDSALIETGQYGVQVRYEADLWGRLASQTEAERQRYLAQGYTLASLRLTIAAELVRGYLQAQSLSEARSVLEENVHVLDDQLRLSRRRYDVGAISELDLQRFRSELEDSRAQLAETTQQLRAVQRALLLLAGQLPTDERVAHINIESEERPPAVLPTVPTGLPSSLLNRRPDLRAAEANLAGAGADLNAARRAWLPTIAITGSAGEISRGLSDLFKDGMSLWSVGATVTQAIFDGGRRNAAIEISDARREQLAESYRATVRQAFGEVLDALDARTAADAVYRARTEQSDALQTALRLAQRRYDEGYSDYLGVLDARRSLLQSRLAVAEARRNGGAAYVDLVLAIGGGWSEST